MSYPAITGLVLGAMLWLLLRCADCGWLGQLGFGR
jgi:hypothetical protein